jgi:hypothetical protein
MIIIATPLDIVEHDTTFAWVGPMHKKTFKELGHALVSLKTLNG